MKLPLRLALIGFLIELCFVSFWSLEDKFNFFHLPTVEAVAKMTGNYTQPALRSWLEDANFVLCPPLVITVFGMDMGSSANLVLVSIAAMLNAALYFVIGFGILCVVNAIKSPRSRSPG